MIRNAALPGMILTLFIIAGLPACSSRPTERLDLSTREWREDLAFFARELPARHGNAFHFTPRARFEAAVAELDHRLGGMNADQVYVGLDGIANLVGDGHTYLKFPRDTPDFPLAFRRFGSDYRAVIVTPGLERALGARLVAIDDTPVARAHDLILPLTPLDEGSPLREANVTSYLSNGVVLHGLGIAPSRDSVRFTLADSTGHASPLEVHALPVGGAEPAWVSACRETPLYRTNPDRGFWATYLPDSRAVYCSFRRYADLRKNAQELFRLLDKERPRKLVVDLRQNTGGDYTVGEHEIIRPLAARADLNQRGRLFVLIGPQTFSAGMNNAAQFRTQTAALLVGETIGEKPNSWQEPREFILPHSHLTVRYSTRLYEFAKSGENVVRPDQEIAPTWEEYRAGRDPALDWILAYDAEHPPAAAAGR